MSGDHNMFQKATSYLSGEAFWRTAEDQEPPLGVKMLLLDIYKQFTEKAAKGRKMEYAKLEKLARGRIRVLHRQQRDRLHGDRDAGHLPVAEGTGAGERGTGSGCIVIWNGKHELHGGKGERRWAGKGS